MKVDLIEPALYFNLDEKYASRLVEVYRELNLSHQYTFPRVLD